MSWKMCRWAVGLALVTAAVLTSGCSTGALYHMLKGEEEMKPEFPLTPPSGKREVTVAVSVTSPPGIPVGADLELARKIGSQMKALAEVNKDTRIVVIDQQRMNSFKTNDPTRWNTDNPGSFASKMGADYWVDVNLRSLNLLDKSLGGEVCRGSAVMEVAVYEAGKGEPKYAYPFTDKAQLKPSDPAQIDLYCGQYLGQIATKIAFKHVKYKADQMRAVDGFGH